MCTVWLEINILSPYYYSTGYRVFSYRVSCNTQPRIKRILISPLPILFPRARTSIFKHRQEAIDKQTVETSPIPCLRAPSFVLICLMISKYTIFIATILAEFWIRPVKYPIKKTLKTRGLGLIMERLHFSLHVRGEKPTGRKRT